MRERRSATRGGLLALSPCSNASRRFVRCYFSVRPPAPRLFRSQPEPLKFPDVRSVQARPALTLALAMREVGIGARAAPWVDRRERGVHGVQSVSKRSSTEGA